MKKILAIGASNSSTSINKKLATFTAHQLKDASVTVVDWDNLELPLYSPELEAASGIPDTAHNFLKMVQAADGIILSLAEHNGLPSAAFKNLWDWTSRIEGKFWGKIPMLLMATSPGGRGGSSVLEIIDNVIPHRGGNVVARFSLPSFQDNFQEGKLTNQDQLDELMTQLNIFENAL